MDARLSDQIIKIFPHNSYNIILSDHVAYPSHQTLHILTIFRHIVDD
jgi:hypothetical protein